MKYTKEDYLADKLAGKLEKYTYIAEKQYMGQTTFYDPPIRMKIDGLYIPGQNEEETYEEWKARKEAE